ncbi:hypothetical protein J7K28_03085 [Candidatus Aerophobetes bacterium]|nr:hypothetical protein [Candidatus Aerophobetes bacterium]
MRIIRIVTDEVQMEAELNESETAKAIWEKLPIEGRVNLWGEEIYFKIPVKKEIEKGVETVEIGNIAYWPEGQCFCIFFGKTPISTEKEIRPASEVNLVGSFLGDPEEWKRVKEGEKIIIERK